MIIKKIDIDHHNRCLRDIGNDSLFVSIIPTSCIWVYRTISYEDTLLQNVFMEFCISPREEKLFELLLENKDSYDIFEKLPSWLDDEKEYNLPGDKSSFLNTYLMLTNITIISPSQLRNYRNDTSGILYFVTEDKKLFANFRLYS